MSSKRRTPLKASRSKQERRPLPDDPHRRADRAVGRVVIQNPGTSHDRMLSPVDRPSTTGRQREVCLQYVCAEAPLFLDTPAILGMPSSLNCYHQRLPLAELLYARGAGLRASRNQGHAILTPAIADGDADDR